MAVGIRGPLVIWGGFRNAWFRWGSHPAGLPCREAAALCTVDNFTFHSPSCLPGFVALLGAMSTVGAG